jgi:DNA-binding beta-propeller fold protein YncE
LGAVGRTFRLASNLLTPLVFLSACGSSATSGGASQAGLDGAGGGADVAWLTDAPGAGQTSEASPDTGAQPSPGMDAASTASEEAATAEAGGDSSVAPEAASPAESGVPAGPAKIVLVAGSLMTPFGVAVDPVAGDLYVADYGDSTVRHIDSAGTSATIVGAGATGPGASVTLNKPHDLLFQPKTKNLFIADTFGGRVLRMDGVSGTVTVFAGGTAKIPASGMIFCLAFDPTGTLLYFISAGLISVADLSTGTLKMTLNYANPRVIAVDSKGTLYAVKNTGTGPANLQTVDPVTGAGTDVTGGGPLAAPKHIAIDPDDNVVIADTEGQLVRRYVVSTKSLETLAGNGMAGTGTLGGPPLMAQVTRPHGIFVDATGRIVIADSFNNRVLAIVH